MTIAEKLKELGYRFDNYIDFYVKDTSVNGEQLSETYNFHRCIRVQDGKLLNFDVMPAYIMSFKDMDTINEYYDMLRNEYYDTKKEFESLKGLEPSPKEILNDFIYEIINCEDDDVSFEELASYKKLLKDLEVLSILKKKLNTYDLSLTFKNNTLSANEFNKVNEWLENGN